MQNLSSENEFYLQEENITGFAHSLALKQGWGNSEMDLCKMARIRIPF